MFSVGSVLSRVTITHTLTLTVQRPLAPANSLALASPTDGTWGTLPLSASPASDIWWPSLAITWGLLISSDIWWPLKHVRRRKKAVRILVESFFVTSDITVTSTLIRELMNKVDELNKTVIKLEENNTALADKVKVMEGTETIFNWKS